MGLGTELETSCRTGPPAYMYCSLHGGRVGDNPIPTCFLSPIDCSKIPAQEVKKASFNKFCTCSYFLVSDITVLAKIVLQKHHFCVSVWGGGGGTGFSVYFISASMYFYCKIS